jgi:hypothetical protein
MHEEKSISQKGEMDECIREPKAVETIADLDPPLRGPLRQQILDNTAETLRQRRTIEGISQRAANNIAAPLGDVLQRSVQQRAQERVAEVAARLAANR